MTLFRSTNFIITLILAISFSLRAWNLFSQGHWSSDGLLYYELAQGLLNDGRVLTGYAERTIVTHGNLEFYDNLFLQGKWGHLLLILIAFLFGGVKLESALFLSLVLGTATLYIIYRLGTTLFDENTGLISAALAGLSLVFINYSRTVLTPSASMFFFTLGLLLFFNYFNANKTTRIHNIHPMFKSGLAIGYAFTIHYNLAYYLLLVYISHFFWAVASTDRKARLKDNFLLAVGLATPLVIFEFAYPLVYYIIYHKHSLYTYFQEVLYNALEAGGGSKLWNYFILYLSLAESPAFCVLAVVSAGWTLFRAIKERHIVHIMLVLFALLPPIILSAFNFPLVGRNLAASLPLLAVLSGALLTELVKRLFLLQSGWAATGMVLALMGPGLFHLTEAYRIKSPYVQIRKDLQNNPLLMVGKDTLYREAFLYRISETISVVPSIDTALKDPGSRSYHLLLKEKSPLLNCKPVKNYYATNPRRFRPIRYENRIMKPKQNIETKARWVIYNLNQCIKKFQIAPIRRDRSVTEIGRHFMKIMSGPARRHFETGMNYFKANYIEEANYEFRQAIEHNPLMFQAYTNLALALIRRGRFNDALATLNTAEQIAGGMLEVQNLFGLVYLAKMDFDEAEKYFKKAVKINPKHPNAYQNLILIYTQAKPNPEKATIYIQKLKKLTKN